MKTARIKLNQDGCVTGPTTRIQTTSENAVAHAIAWAETQPTGDSSGSWDCILVNVYDDETEQGVPETHQVEHRDGSWEEV